MCSLCVNMQVCMFVYMCVCVYVRMCMCTVYTGVMHIPLHTHTGGCVGWLCTARDPQWRRSGKSMMV